MKKEEVQAAAQAWAEQPGRFVTGLGDHPEPDAYIRAFDGAMDVLVAYAGSVEEMPQLGLALAFSSAERGEDTSYRQVMKKYTRSVVFEDLQIHLLLARDDGSVEDIPPGEVNLFLIDLNRYIHRKLNERE